MFALWVIVAHVALNPDKWIFRNFIETFIISFSFVFFLNIKSFRCVFEKTQWFEFFIHLFIGLVDTFRIRSLSLLYAIANLDYFESKN